MIRKTLLTIMGVLLTLGAASQVSKVDNAYSNHPIDLRYEKRCIENNHGYDGGALEKSPMNEMKPTKPELLDVKFVYDHFDYDLLRFDNDARFEVTLYSENSDKFVIMNAPDMNINKYDSYILLYDAENVENVGDNLYRLSAMFDFDTDIYFYAKNKYGSSLHSDSIHTNDYITDPNIIDAINQASAIKDATGYEKSIILFHENVLSFAKEVKQVTIMDLTGRILYEQNDNGRINLANRQKGIYVITVLTNNNKRITKKIRI